MGHNENFELPSNSGNPEKNGKFGGLSKSFYRLDKPPSTIPHDKNAAAFWDAQALVKPSDTSDTSVPTVLTTDTQYPTAQGIFGAVDLSRLNYGLYQGRVADTLRTINDAITSSPRI